MKTNIKTVEIGGGLQVLNFACSVFAIVAVAVGGGAAAAEIPLVDVSLADFLRLKGEEDDTARLQRMIDAAAPHGVAYVPRGVYLLSSTLMATNGASILLHKSAILRATKPMDYVLRIDLARQWKKMYREDGKVNGAAPAAEDRQEDYNGFLIGGQIDGNGLASCVALDNYHHYTLRDTTFLNGLKSGLNLGHFGHGYEVIANNLYFKTVIHGCKGNVAILQEEWDSHFTDCVIVDYTIGIRTNGGSNRFTRCHVWGGPIREMLDDSINFDVRGGSDIFRDCYCDTGKIGFRVNGQCRIFGCEYFSNPVFGLDGITCIEHIGGRLTVDSGFFIKTAKDVTLYKGCGKVIWANCDVKGFTPEETPWNASFSGRK